MACIATWSFGLKAVEVAAESIKAGEDCVDILENAINGRFTRAEYYLLKEAIFFLETHMASALSASAV